MDEMQRFYQDAEQVRNEVLAVLSTGNAFYPREIAAKLHLTSNTVRNVLLELMRAGTVSRNGKIGKSRYSLTGQKELELTP